MNTLIHPFDILNADGDLDLFAEELPEQVQRNSDCVADTHSCGSCWAPEVRRWASFGAGLGLK